MTRTILFFVLFATSASAQWQFMATVPQPVDDFIVLRWGLETNGFRVCESKFMEFHKNELLKFTCMDQFDVWLKMVEYPESVAMKIWVNDCGVLVYKDTYILLQKVIPRKRKKTFPKYKTL